MPPSHPEVEEWAEELDWMKRVIEVKPVVGSEVDDGARGLSQEKRRKSA